MSAASLARAKQRVDSIVANYQRLAGLPELTVLGRLTAGKVYEAWILCVVLEHLSARENLKVRMVGGTELRLKSSPGPINRSYPYFEASRRSEVYEIWTDIEFLTLSYRERGERVPTAGEYHELDLVLVQPGIAGRPSHDQILLGVECKNTPYTKDLLRAILGVRRELSFLQDSIPTAFDAWPRSAVPAHPPSCLLVYCTSRAVLDYAAPGETFGIDFIHEPLP